MYRLFIDETGNPDEGASNDPERRFANLTGVVIEETHYTNHVIPDYNATRARHFGHKADRPIVLHRQWMAQRKGVFRCLNNQENRNAWLADQDRMLTEYDYTIISVTMDKAAF